MLTLIFFSTIQVEKHGKIDDRKLFSLLINAAIIILTAVIRNRTRPFRAELFNIVTGSNLNLNIN